MNISGSKNCPPAGGHNVTVPPIVKGGGENLKNASVQVYTHKNANTRKIRRILEMN